MSDEPKESPQDTFEMPATIEKGLMIFYMASHIGSWGLGLLLIPAFTIFSADRLAMKISFSFVIFFMGLCTLAASFFFWKHITVKLRQTQKERPNKINES